MLPRRRHMARRKFKKRKKKVGFPKRHLRLPIITERNTEKGSLRL